MKKYLVSILWSGEIYSERVPNETVIIRAKDDLDIIRKMYISIVCGCDLMDKEEFEESSGRKYDELTYEECVNGLEECEDVLEFIYDENLNLVYEAE